MNFGKYLPSARKEGQPGGVKAERTHSVNYNSSTLQSVQILMLNYLH